MKINSKVVMNEDIVLSNDKQYQVSIQGRYNTYLRKDGMCYNVACDYEGYFRNLETNQTHRAAWVELTIVKRARPELFTEDGKHLLESYRYLWWEKEDVYKSKYF